VNDLEDNKRDGGAMKAAAVMGYGGPEVFEYREMPDPVAGAGEVLVKVTATSVNPVDIKYRSGFEKFPASEGFPTIVGLDLSGIVVKLGEGVDVFSVGDLVFGMAWPAYAELCAVKATDLAKLPAGLDPIDAAALPLVTTTGYKLTESAEVQAGQKVVITGAVGGVGRCTLFAAKAKGAFAIAAVLGKDAHEATTLGADQVIATDEDAALSRLQDLDSVCDTVGGKLGEALIGKIKEGGVFATVVAPPANAPTYPKVKIVLQHTLPDPKALEEMAHAFMDGRLIIPLGPRFPLSQAGKAHAAIADHTAVGKVVLVVGS
jgi:NADPH:quinone reductase-like Zn-dependent oxidoreductase